MALSDVLCRRAAPRAKVYKLTDGSGLTLRVTPRGGKYWVWRYSFDGRQRDLSLGAYPRLSLAEARRLRDSAAAAVREGVDPTLHRLMSRAEAAIDRKATFEVVARKWLEQYLPRRTAKYGRQVVRRLEADIFPQIGKIPIAAISAPMVLHALRPAQDRGVDETVRRLKQYIGMIMRFAVAHGQARHDMTADLRGALRPPQTKHYASIAGAELPELIWSLNQPGNNVGMQTKLAIRLMMLTFVRTGELVGAKWAEFDFERALWVIPAARMKMKRDHFVPLSRQALETLKVLKLMEVGGFVFPGRVRNTQPISNNTVLTALHRAGWRGRMTGHGFRALATTVLHEDLEWPKEVIDLQLAHAKADKIWAAYDRTKFLRRRTEMMQAWADYVSAAEARAKTLHQPAAGY